MRQPIAGVTPSETAEATVMTVWPSISIYPLGRWLGERFSIKWPDFYFIRVGSLLALVTIPITLVLYLLRVAPKRGVRYTLTNRNVSISRGITAVVESQIALEGFDEIQIKVAPGQEWYKAGDLIFLLDSQDVFQLSNVPHPDAFREVCLKTRAARVRVREVVAQQTPVVENAESS